MRSSTPVRRSGKRSSRINSSSTRFGGRRHLIGGPRLGAVINVHPVYGDRAIERLHEIAGVPSSLASELEATVERSAVVATALVSLLGYATNAELVKESPSTGRGDGEIAVERGLIEANGVDALSPRNPGWPPLRTIQRPPGTCSPLCGPRRFASVRPQC